MRITELDVQDLHGWLNLATRLDPLVLFTGPNESGKSTLLSVPALVLAGPTGARYPGLGTPSSPWSAAIRLDNATDGRGHWVTRYQRGVALEHDLTIDGRSRGVRAGQGEIERLVGPAGTWQLQDVEAQKQADQVAWFRDHVLGASGWTWERLDSELLAVGAQALDDPDRTVGQAWLELETEPPVVLTMQRPVGSRGKMEDQVLPSPFAELLAVLQVEPAGRSLSPCRNQAPAEWLAETVRRCEALYLGVRRALRALNQAIKEDEAKHLDLPVGTEVEWRDRKVTLDSEVQELLVKRGALVERGEQAQRLGAEVERLERDLAVARLRVPLEEAVATATEARSRAQDQTKIASDGLARARSAHEEATAAVTTATQAVSEGEVLVTSTYAAMENAREAQAMQTRVAYLLELVQAVLALFASPYPEEVQTLQSELATWTATAGSVAQRVRAWEEAKTDLGGLRALADAKTRAATTARQACERATADHTKAQGTEATASTGLDQAKQSLDRAGRVEANVARDLEAARDRVAELGDRSTETVDEAMRATHEAVKDAETKLQMFADHTIHRANLQERRARRRRLDAVVPAVTQLGKAIRAMQQQALAETLAPLVDPANQVLAQVIPGARIVVDLDAGFGWRLDYGRQHDDGHGSTSAETVALVALRCAVVQRLGGLRLVVVDSLNDLEASRRTALVQAMQAEVAAGRLDNVMGAWVPDGWTAPDGVQVLDLGAARELTGAPDRRES